MTISIYRGEKKIWNGAATDGGSAVDLTGATIHFTVRSKYPASSVVNDTDAVLHKSTSDGIVIISAVGGTFTLTLLEADTNALLAGDYYYGLEYENAAGGPYTLDEGIFTIKPDVVRST